MNKKTLKIWQLTNRMYADPTRTIAQPSQSPYVCGSDSVAFRTNVYYVFEEPEEFVDIVNVTAVKPRFHQPRRYRTSIRLCRNGAMIIAKVIRVRNVWRNG